MRDWPCEGLGGLRNDASACRWVPIRRQPRAPFVGENGGDYGPHGSWSFPFLIYIVLNWGHRRLGPIYSNNEGSRLVYDVYSRPRRSCPQLRTIYINLRTTACVPLPDTPHVWGSDRTIDWWSPWCGHLGGRSPFILCLSTFDL